MMLNELDRATYSYDACSKYARNSISAPKKYEFLVHIRLAWRYRAW